MFQWIKEQPDLGKVDICIANAGYGEKLSLLEGNVGPTLIESMRKYHVPFSGNVADWRKMMDVNVIALNQCTQFSVKSMVEVN